jgi:hypothetical protein
MSQNIKLSLTSFKFKELENVNEKDSQLELEEGSYLEFNEEEELISKENNNNESNSDSDDNDKDKENIDSNLKSESESNKNHEENSEEKSEFNSRTKKKYKENIIEIEAQQDSEINDIDEEYEMLFCVQGIGKYIENKEKKGEKIYEKGEFCEPSLRDIHRFLRKDDSENPRNRLLILNWKVAEKDLIPLMLNNIENEKIQQLGLVLLTDLTEPLGDLVETRDIFENLLSDLQYFISRSKILEILAQSLSDSTAKLKEANLMKNEIKKIENKNININTDMEIIMENNEEDIEAKKKRNEIKKKISEIEYKNEQKIELIFVFLKQLMNIFYSNTFKKNNESLQNILENFSSTKIFDAIIYHSQNFLTDFSLRLAPILLEFIFLLTRNFNVLKIFEFCRNNNLLIKEGNKHVTELSLIRDMEKKEKEIRNSLLSHRPNNFGTTLKIKRPLDNSVIIISNYNEFIQNPEKIINERMNFLKDQKKKPFRKLVKNNKVKMNATKIVEEIKMINDAKLSESILFDCSHKFIIISMKNFCEDFLKFCFNNFTKYFIGEILSRSEQFEKYDFYYLINLFNFFLNFERLKIYENIQNEKEKYEKEKKFGYGYNETNDNNNFPNIPIKKKDFNDIYNLDNIYEAISPQVMDFIYK